MDVSSVVGTVSAGVEGGPPAITDASDAITTAKITYCSRKDIAVLRNTSPNRKPNATKSINKEERSGSSILRPALNPKIYMAVDSDSER